MKTLTFNAPAHHMLAEGGRRIPGGCEFEVSDKRAAELLADSTISVTEIPAGVVDALADHDEQDLRRFSREELNELAGSAGVHEPEQLANKDAVIAALQQQLQHQAAGTAATVIPRAADGEAQPQQGEHQ